MHFPYARQGGDTSLGRALKDPVFVDVVDTTSGICQARIDTSTANCGADLPLASVCGCQSCCAKEVDIRTLHEQLKQAHERIEELKGMLQESQQALLVQLASKSLAQQTEDQQQNKISCGSCPVGVARVGQPVMPNVKLSCNVHVPPLIRSAERGEVNAVEDFLRSGEDPNCTDDMGLTALHGAVKKGHSDVIRLLLHWRANPNNAASWRGEMPLHYACKYGHEDGVRLLLLSRAHPNVSSYESKTPLEYAQQKKHKAIEAAIRQGLRFESLLKDHGIGADCAGGQLGDTKQRIASST